MSRFAPPAPQPTAPTTRARYKFERSANSKWNGVRFKQWSWARLVRDVNDVFKAGDVVCLLSVQSGRISPTPRQGQATSWTKSDADTDYRIAKWTREEHLKLFLCEDIKGSINHKHLSRQPNGTPDPRAHYADGEIVYLLPGTPGLAMPGFFVRYPHAKGERLPIPAGACGMVYQPTSFSSGMQVYNRLQARSGTVAPQPAAATSRPDRTYYLVAFPVAWTSADWEECNVAVNTVYLQAVSELENSQLESQLTAVLPRPKVMSLPAQEVQTLQMQPQQ